VKTFITDKGETFTSRKKLKPLGTSKIFLTFETLSNARLIVFYETNSTLFTDDFRSSLCQCAGNKGNGNCWQAQKA
jgi:hypothetical protein